MKSMSGFNNGCQVMDSLIYNRFDCVLIVNGASHTNLDDVQSHLYGYKECSPVGVEGEFPGLHFEVLDCASGAEKVVSKGNAA
eukprot:1152251-Pelagomonas_calceolata.AAC.4